MFLTKTNTNNGSGNSNRNQISGRGGRVKEAPVAEDMGVAVTIAETTQLLNIYLKGK